MESSEIILLFLKKMRLERHHSTMISNSLFKLNTIDDLQFLLTNVNYLEEIGLSPAEINRFKRLYEKTLKVECSDVYKIPWPVQFRLFINKWLPSRFLFQTIYRSVCDYSRSFA